MTLEQTGSFLSVVGPAGEFRRIETWVQLHRGHAQLSLFTPHLGSAVAAARAAIEAEAASNIIAVLRGEVPEGAVNSPIQDRPALGASLAEENDES